jgi:hypothetical protein
MMNFVKGQGYVVSMPHLFWAGFLPLILWGVSSAVNLWISEDLRRVSPAIEARLRDFYSDSPSLTPVVKECQNAMPYRRYGRLVIPAHFEENVSEEALLWSVRAMLDSARKMPLDDAFLRFLVLGLYLQGMIILGPFLAIKMIYFAPVWLFLPLIGAVIDQLNWLSAKRVAREMGEQAARVAMEYGLNHLKSNPDRRLIDVWNLRWRLKWMGISDA